MSIIRANAIARLTLRLPGPVTATVPSASLYSDRFMNLDQTKKKIEKIKLVISDQSQAKEKIKAEYSTNGIKNIFNEEIYRMLLISNTSEDMEFCRKVLTAQLQDSLHSLDYPSLSYKYQLFFDLCHINNLPQVAIKCWNQPEVRAFLPSLRNRKWIIKPFFDLLFENQLYRELLEEFGRETEYYSNTPGQCPLVLASLAHYRIGSRDSLEELIKLIPLVERSRLSKSRVLKAASLLAYNLGELAVAHSVLARQMRTRVQERRKFSPFADSLNIKLLIATGKLEEAVTLFRVHFLPTCPQDRLSVHYCLVRDLLAAVKKEDGNLCREVMEMVLIIENSDQVFLNNHSLEDELFGTIDVVRKDKGK